MSPGTEGLVIVDVAGERRAVWQRWAYRPSWSTRPARINATSEKLFTNGLWKHSARRRRCVIVADGFFEPEGPKRPKRPQHYFHLQENSLLAIAGIWAPSKTPAGDAYDSFAIVTCEPGPVVGAIHSRSPVMLPADAIDAWLNPKSEDLDILQAMLLPGEPALLSHQVTDSLYKLSPDDAGCITPYPLS